jgi:hypothetical protein
MTAQQCFNLGVLLLYVVPAVVLLFNVKRIRAVSEGDEFIVWIIIFCPLVNLWVVLKSIRIKITITRNDE